MADEGILKLTPTSDYRDPGRSTTLHGGSSNMTYAGGTYNEALTGHYYTNHSSQRGDRPVGHGKALSRDRSGVVAVRGSEMPLAAQRGVGQPSIDGFVQAGRVQNQVQNDEAKAAIAAFLQAIVANAFNSNMGRR